jgi:hypothetical protein
MEMILILARGHDSVARRGVLRLHLTPMDAPATGGCGGGRWRVHQGGFGAWEQPFSVTFDFDLGVKLILISSSSRVHASLPHRARHTWLYDVYDLSWRRGVHLQLEGARVDEVGGATWIVEAPQPI